MGRREHKGGGHAEGDGLRRDRGDRARQGLPHQAPPREGPRDREVSEVPQEDGARIEVGREEGARGVPARARGGVREPREPDGARARVEVARAAQAPQGPLAPHARDRRVRAQEGGALVRRDPRLGPLALAAQHGLLEHARGPRRVAARRPQAQRRPQPGHGPRRQGAPRQAQPVPRRGRVAPALRRAHAAHA